MADKAKKANYWLLIGGYTLACYGLLQVIVGLSSYSSGSIYLGVALIIVGSIMIISGSALILVKCPNCGYAGVKGRRMRGNFAIELILWLCFIIPGLLYSMWRGSTKGKICPKCGAGNLIPIENIDEVAEKKCPFCAETIKAAAVVCKHCGRELAPDSP